MISYLLLLRGINLGKQNKVSMPELRQQLEIAGFNKVSSYINTGNLFFETDLSVTQIEEKIETLLSSHYDFSIPFVVLSSEKILREAMPSWWYDEAYRKDALFYLRGVDKQLVEEMVATWSVTEDETYFLGETALFWCVRTEALYRQSAHAKKIMARPFNQMLTLRNANTTMKLLDLLRGRIEK